MSPYSLTNYELNLNNDHLCVLGKICLNALEDFTDFNVYGHWEGKTKCFLKR